MLVDFVAGGAAGFCSVIASQPADVMKTKMQGADGHMYKGVIDGFS